MIKIEKLPQSRIRFELTVDQALLAEQYELALAEVKAGVEIKGFRQGQAPRSLVIAKVGNGTVINSMLERVLPIAYEQALRGEEFKTLFPVESPQIEITALEGLSEDSLIPTGLKAKVEVDCMPEIKLPAYRQFKLKLPPTEPVTSQDLDKVTGELAQIYGPEWYSKLQFADQAAAEAALQQNLEQDKAIQQENASYDLILKTLIEKTKVDVPEAFIHNEIHRLEHQYTAQAKYLGLSLEELFEQQKLPAGDAHKALRPKAIEAAKVGLILGKIAENEGIFS
ncbi:MAG: trigger factor [Candidatus Berkelbacteria bacterium Gr01-1014_85]|uniref:Trigger factor n=1 Tax=Candidatus Berkelbacteria bacterium Gr01-1014_85 TaxID=2017150 RepID=A0A554JBV6_9BACT|nr:MAG: trigger factor [Candidatus Berkelbacteria bacterium Gr01-1014_85]